MQAKNKIKFLALLCAAVVFGGWSLPGASAQENPRESASKPGVAVSQKAGGKRYFVQFRARSALSYGHTFLVHGRLTAGGHVGKVAKEQVAGLHPATDSSVPWMIGHIIPVVAEQGWSDGDNEDEYITAAYRIDLTEAEYAKVSAFIRQHQKNSPMWHAVLYNCNAWVADVAKFMGLKTPGSTMLYPEEYITTLASLNGGKVTRPAAGSAASSRNAKPAAKPKPQTAATPAASDRTVR